jgi:hypothetical protein
LFFNFMLALAALPKLSLDPKSSCLPVANVAFILIVLIVFYMIYKYDCSYTCIYYVHVFLAPYLCGDFARYGALVINMSKF